MFIVQQISNKSVTLLLSENGDVRKADIDAIAISDELLIVVSELFKSNSTPPPHH